MCKVQLEYKYKSVLKIPQSFTGKERDSETGFSYFGARYYDSDILTGWLSVDPMADKYPSLSPYAYCGWNPIKLVDPNGDSITMSSDAWKIQLQAFKSVFDKKDEKIPFSYDEQTQKMYYTGINENYVYSDQQKEIIEHYKSLCEDPNFNIHVQIVDNDFKIPTSNGGTSLLIEFANGLIVRNENFANVYISNRPMYREEGELKFHPQIEDYQSIAILHEIGGHAYNYSKNIVGKQNNKNTTDFEDLCRSVFRGKYGMSGIRREKATPHQN